MSISLPHRKALLDILSRLSEDWEDADFLRKAITEDILSDEDLLEVSEVLMMAVHSVDKEEIDKIRERVGEFVRRIKKEEEEEMRQEK